MKTISDYTPEQTLREEIIKQQEIEEQHENYDAWHNFWFSTNYCTE
ncbi:MAG: hypothetical protein MJZ30_05835 [Paludibacteraceae bacterium]|nr:hypothetical protein [Paludibacteraceae bacterium]